MSLKNIYRHYLTIGSSVIEVFPLGFNDTSLVDEQERDQVFYRRKFSGTLTFINNSTTDDFDLLYLCEQSYPCDKILYLIERMGVYYWDGYFSTSDGKFDLDNCNFEVTPNSNDDYSDILDNVNIQYNIISVYPTVITRAIIHRNSYDMDVTYSRNKWLIDVIAYLAEKIYDPDGSIVADAVVSSTFFTAATNPVTLVANMYTLLTIAQKSDIIRPGSSDSATTAMMSWKELMDILWTMFQVTWTYDGAGTFTIEHISFFTPAAGIDLQTQEICKAMNKYSYAKEKMPKYEKFFFMESDEVNFVGVPIKYENACIDNNPETNIIEKSINVTTDLEYIYTNADAISDDGFVILCNYLDGGSYHVKTGVGSYAALFGLNMDLSWGNLHNSFYRHNRVLIEGYLNDNLTTFWTSQRNKLQELPAIICPADLYDPADEITTELGETWLGSLKAIVKRSELSPSGSMNFNLLYGTDDNTPTPITTVKMALVAQTDTCITFNVTLTDPAPGGGLAITLQETVYDPMGIVCTGGIETWTVPAGSYTATYTMVSMCKWPLDPGEWLEFDVHVTTAGWLMEYDFDETCSGM